MKAEHLTRILLAGIRAVRPDELFPRIFSEATDSSLQDWLYAENRHLLCAGKAAIHSAESILRAVSCKNLFVLSPEGIDANALPPGSVHRGSHPVPDSTSIHSTNALLQWIDSIAEGERLLVSLSGGSSALLVCPPPDISAESKFELNRLLLSCGASIDEMNAVRKHCSAVKGGQLGKIAARLQPLVLAISDVVGDDPAVIGSGPFYPDPTTFAEARSVLESHGVWDRIPTDIRSHIELGIAGSIPETPKPGMLNIPHRIVASNALARKAAAEEAAHLGYNIRVFEQPVTGFVEDAAARIRGWIEECPPNTALILGGEVTVRLTGNGTGGRNQHLALLLTESLAGTGTWFASAGTDGVDGNSRAAGAWTCGDTARESSSKGLHLRDAIRRFDSFPFFDLLGQSILTGPTGTNVMDLYVALT